jgi:hypothetical protein
MLGKIAGIFLQNRPAKSSNSMPTPVGSKIAILSVGCREWRRESHTRVPQTNLPAVWLQSKVVEEGRKSEYLGILPRTNRREISRDAVEALELWQRRLDSTCGDTIAHVMEFAARQDEQGLSSVAVGIRVGTHNERPWTEHADSSQVT